jgi:hypothetical protein
VYFCFGFVVWLHDERDAHIPRAWPLGGGGGHVPAIMQSWRERAWARRGLQMGGVAPDTLAVFGREVARPSWDK